MWFHDSSGKKVPPHDLHKKIQHTPQKTFDHHNHTIVKCKHSQISSGARASLPFGGFYASFFPRGGLFVFMGGPFLGLPPLWKFLRMPMICELLEPRDKYGRTKMLIDL